MVIQQLEIYAFRFLFLVSPSFKNRVPANIIRYPIEDVIRIVYKINQSRNFRTILLKSCIRYSKQMTQELLQIK